MSRLTDAQVTDILMDPADATQVATRYGVSKGLIRQIRTGRAYAHVPRPENMPERGRVSAAVRETIRRKRRFMTLDGISELTGVPEATVRAVLKDG